MVVPHVGGRPWEAIADVRRDRARKSPRPTSTHDIETGYLTALALRSGFTSLPLHELETTEPALIAERCALTRFILDRTRHLGQ